MGTIREKMKADLELRGFAATTQTEYLRRAYNFAAHYKRSPADMGEKEIRGFILHLINEKKVRPATHAMYVAAIKFLYVTTLGRPKEVAELPWPKKPQVLPDIVTAEEVEQLFHAMKSIKHEIDQASRHFDDCIRGRAEDLGSLYAADRRYR